MRTRSFRLLALVVFGAFLVLACDLGASTGGASAKPTILIQSPVNGSQFQEGSEITVQSVATDASGIAMVDLIVDGAVVRTDKPSAGQSGPLFAFKQKWQATAGAHTIDVRAYNAAGTPSDPMIIAIIVLSSAAQAPSPFPGLATTVLSPAVVPSPPTPTSTVPSPPTPTSTVTAMATVSPTAAVAAASPVVLPPCPPGSATPSGMLFCDDFASQAISKSKGWSFYTAPEDDFTWSPSIATLTVKQQDYWTSVNGPAGKYDNFGAEIEAQPLSDGYAEYGLIFRTSGDVNNFYLLALSTDGGYFMDKQIAGNRSDSSPVKWTSAPSVRPGKSKNLIGVIAQGNTFALYINHVLVNTVTDDSLPGSGLVGVYAYNSPDSANAIVAFSLLAVLTPDQARAEWSDAAPAPSSSSQPTNAPPQPPAPPGLYVTAMGMDQAQPAHGQNVNFTVSFLNTGSGDLSVKWKVYIYRADNPAKSNTESAAVPATFHPGPTMDQPVPMNFKLGSTGNDCDYFFARVDTLDVNNKPTDLTTTDGKVFEKGFSVCK